MPRYRIALTNGTVFITEAANAACARTEAFIRCPDMQLFNVHIASTQRLKPIAEPTDAEITAYIAHLSRVDDDAGIE